jgi:RHS repeat-associated protein
VTGSTLTYVHGDHLGTPIVMTDATGTQVTQPAGYFTPAFPGQSRTLPDLYYNRYRDYDPTTGRYIQADPIGLEGGANPYNYAMGNPVRYTDPDGRAALAAAPFAGGGSGAFAFCATPVGVWVCAGVGIGAVGALIWYNWDDYEAAPIPGGGLCPVALFKKSGDSGRYGGGIGSNYPGDETGDPCKQEWDDARIICLQKGKYGSKLMKCMLGYVSRRCGGNRPDYEHDSRSPKNVRPKNWRPDLDE